MFQKYENIFIEMDIFTHNNVCKSRSVAAERSAISKKNFFFGRTHYKWFILRISSLMDENS